MFLGIEHVAIAAQDTDALSKWYCDVLDFTVAYKNAKTPATYFVRGASGSMIEIIPAGEACPVLHDEKDPGLRHLAISVDDFDAAYADLQAKGVSFTSGPKEASGGVKLVFFTDSEGNLLHLIYRPNAL
ncbi:MAG: VOC family protein [Candidatus Latescibacterota bacterium]